MPIEADGQTLIVRVVARPSTNSTAYSGCRNLRPTSSENAHRRRRHASRFAPATPKQHGINVMLQSRVRGQRSCRLLGLWQRGLRNPARAACKLIRLYRQNPRNAEVPGLMAGLPISYPGSCPRITLHFPKHPLRDTPFSVSSYHVLQIDFAMGARYRRPSD